MASIAMQVAAHLGCDVADIRDYDYQPGCWNRKVFAGMDGNRYWSAGGKTAPKHKEGANLHWKQVPSNYPGNPPLWVGE